MSRLLHQATLAALAAVLTCGPALAQTAAASDELGAKALFYSAAGDLVSVSTAASKKPVATVAAAPRPTNQLQQQPQPAVLGLRGTVLLVGSDGGTREVKPSHVFKSGDRVKVALSSNRAGYLYLIAVGASGKIQMMAPRQGEPATVQPGLRYQFPASPTAYFRFDQQAGREEIWAVLSDEPLDVVSLGPERLVAINRPAGDTRAQPGERVAHADQMLASKDLVFEEDADAAYSTVRPPVTPVSLSTVGRQAVTLKMVLNHRP